MGYRMRYMDQLDKLSNDNMQSNRLIIRIIEISEDIMLD